MYKTPAAKGDARESTDKRMWITVALSACVAAFVAIAIISLHGRLENVSESRVSRDRYNAILDKGVIRAGFYVGAPYFTIDPNTKRQGGIFYEIVEGIAKKLNLKVEWTEEVGFGEMAEGLNGNRFDVIGSGVWINASRGAVADFSIPVIFDAVGLYSRMDDHRFDANASKANSKATRISTIDGEMAAAIAQQDFPEATIVSLPQNVDFTQMVLNVLDNKADVTLLGLATASKYNATHPGKIRNVDPAHPLRVFPTAIMLPQNEYALKRAIDLALTEMINNGEVEAIVSRYEEAPGSHYRVAPEFTSPK